MTQRQVDEQRTPEKPEQRSGWKPRLLYLAPLTVIVVGIVGLLVWFMLLPPSAEIRQIVSSREALLLFLRASGWRAPVIFFLLQIGQVIFSPIPGNVTTLAGGVIFGIWQGFALSGAGIVIGSLLAFLLARLYGQRVVILLAGQRHFERYNRLLTNKGGIGLLLLFLLPFLPDDLLCLLAGLSALPLRVFLLLLLIGRLPMTFLITLIGAGVLSFSWWGWMIIALLTLGILVLFFKYGNTFERWLQ